MAKKETDRFGNPLYEPTTIEEVPEILRRVQQLANPPPLSRSQMAEVQLSVFGRLFPMSMFLDCTFYVQQCDCTCSEQLSITELDIRMHGGLVKNVMADDVTHILVHNDCQCDTLKNYADKLKLVNSNWIEECIRRGEKF